MSRELDIAVAEKVMGYRIGVIPEYSTSIAAAWQVVEKMRAGGWNLKLGVDAGDGPTATCAEFERGRDLLARLAGER